MSQEKPINVKLNLREGFIVLPVEKIKYWLENAGFWGSDITDTLESGKVDVYKAIEVKLTRAICQHQFSATTKNNITTIACKNCKTVLQINKDELREAV